MANSDEITALKRDKEKAEEASRLKSEFLARVTHDLRTPLNGIIGFAELMHDEKAGPISGVQKEYLSDILISSRHLLVLINDVLDLAKIESGKMEFNAESVDLNKIMAETHIIFQPMIAKKNIHFEIEIDPKLNKVITDPARLKQVIYNYVSNALKCTQDGGHVIVRILPENETLFRVEVEDTGIGIRKEDLKELFVEFQQLDRKIAKQYPSSGLGLALTRHIVEAQQGTVGVNSTFGVGSTFYAVLPRIPKKG